MSKSKYHLFFNKLTLSEFQFTPSLLWNFLSSVSAFHCSNSRSPLICKEIKQVNPKRNQPWIWTDVEAQYFGHLMQRANSLEKTLMLGKIEGKRRRGWQRMRWLDSITDSMDMNSRRQWRTEEPGVLQSMGSQRAGRDVVTEQQPHLSCHVYSPFPGPGEKDGSTQSLKC